jgi:hypothetical protein
MYVKELFEIIALMNPIQLNESLVKDASDTPASHRSIKLIKKSYKIASLRGRQNML